MTRQPRRRASGRAPRPRRAADTETARPPVAIDLDPAVSAGFIHGRYDLLLRGRAVCRVPLEEIVVRLDDAVIARLLYGPVEPDGQDDGTQHVFHVNVPLRRAEAHRTCTCTVAARIETGEWHEERFGLVVDPANPMPVSVASGPTHGSWSYAHVRPPVVLYVERAALDDSGQLLVHGWAVSLSAMVTVQVFLDAERVDAAALGGQRNDVAAAFPAYPNAGASGFTLSRRIDVDAGTVSTVRVQAISKNGSLHEAVVPVERVHALAAAPAARAERQPAQVLPAPPDLPPLPSAPEPASPPTLVRDPRRDIRFFCDEMDLDAEGHLNVVGWAICAVGISAVAVHLDDREIGVAELGLPRVDVGDEYRHIPMARHSGFRFAGSAGKVPDGEHRIRVVLRNGLDDQREESRIVRIERAPPPRPAVSEHFRLEIDTPTVIGGSAVEPVTGRLTIEGWVLARSGITGIEVMLDDQRVGDAHYGLARHDVGVAFPDWVDSLRSGYAFHCPPRSLRNGEHVVRLKVFARSGDVLEHRFRIVVRKSEEFEDGTTIRRRLSQVEADLAEDVLNGIGHRPQFRLILRPHPAVTEDALLATVESLRTQVYHDWRLEILADDADAARSLLAEAAKDLAERIDVTDVSTMRRSTSRPAAPAGPRRSDWSAFCRPGIGWVVTRCCRWHSPAVCTGTPTCSTRTRCGKARSAANARRSSSRISRLTCCSPPTISAAPGLPPPRCSAAQA
jgi:hypothetical protein